MSYKTIGMLKDGGLGKDMNSGVHVDYLSAMVRDRYLVSVKKDLLWWQFAPLDTSDDSAAMYIYVMDGAGNIYTATKREVRHHSAFLAGQPAAAAGHWTVKNGKVLSMNALSGHYQPTADYCDQAIVELKKRGVPVGDIETDFGMTSDQCVVGFKRMAGIKGLKWYQRETGARIVTDYATGATLGGKGIVTGTHIQGQRLRLYPGTKPKWSWF